MSDDKQQPRNGVEIPTSKELDEVASDGQSQQGGSQEQKGIRSWVRRFWVWLRRGVWWNKKALKTPQPDVGPVREVPPDIQPVSVPDDTPKRKMTLEEQACAEASENAQEYDHEIGPFSELFSFNNNKTYSAICKQCGLNIDGVVEFDFKAGLVKVGGKAKNARCKGRVGGYSSGTS